MKNIKGHKVKNQNSSGVYSMQKIRVYSTYTLAALLVSGSMAVAAGPAEHKSSDASEKTKTYSSQQKMQSNSRKSQQQMSGAPVVGSHAKTVIFAAINQVNEEEKTITLIGVDGSKMAMEVPEKAMSDLQKGDIVEVSVDKLTAMSIDKGQDAQKSAANGNTSGTQHQTEQGSQKSMQQTTQSSDSASAKSSQSADAASATVESIDTQQGKLTLQMEKSGRTVEMQAPEELLSDLQRGDSVEVTVRKLQHAPSNDSPASKSQSK